MKTIELTKNKVAMVDDADYEWLNQWEWYAQKGLLTFYAARRMTVSENTGHKQQYMHRLILNISDKATVTDHIDHNGLNNQRINLRACSQQQNMMNHKIQKHSSVFKGVSKEKNTGRWRGYIKVSGKRLHLGYFSSEEEAAFVYDEAAKKYFGEFARLNI